MNDTLKKLANLITLREQGTITELDLLLQIHDMWRDLSNLPHAARQMQPDYESTFQIIDFAYIHFKQCCDLELEKATK